MPHPILCSSSTRNRNLSQNSSAMVTIGSHGSQDGSYIQHGHSHIKLDPCDSPNLFFLILHKKQSNLGLVPEHLPLGCLFRKLIVKSFIQTLSNTQDGLSRITVDSVKLKVFQSSPQLLQLYRFETMAQKFVLLVGYP